MPGNETKCVFCEIAAGRAQAYRIAQDALSYAILDINPFAKGHCLVISKRHVVWWHELTEEETASLFNLARRVAQRMNTTLHPDMIVTYARGRRVPHTHIFVVPAYDGDLLDRFFNALERFQESPEELSRLKDPGAMQEVARLLRGE
ncbi:MAG: HIT family protein [Chloroflexi bacterium]|nr:HIT family protein [Chloroflexota bacterium]